MGRKSLMVLNFLHIKCEVCCLDLCFLVQLQIKTCSFLPSYLIGTWSPSMFDLISVQIQLFSEGSHTNLLHKIPIKDRDICGYSGKNCEQVH